MDASEVGRLLKVAQPWLDRYNETVPAANGGTKTAPVEADLRPSLEQLEKLLKQTHLFTSFDMKVQELETATAELNARVANIKHWIRDVDTSLGSFWTHVGSSWTFLAHLGAIFWHHLEKNQKSQKHRAVIDF